MSSLYDLLQDFHEEIRTFPRLEILEEFKRGEEYNHYLGEEAGLTVQPLREEWQAIVKRHLLQVEEAAQVLAEELELSVDTELANIWYERVGEGTRLSSGARTAVKSFKDGLNKWIKSESGEPNELMEEAFNSLLNEIETYSNVMFSGRDQEDEFDLLVEKLENEYENLLPYFEDDLKTIKEKMESWFENVVDDRMEDYEGLLLEDNEDLDIEEMREEMTYGPR